MRTKILATTLILIFASCNNREPTKIERPNEPTVYLVEGDEVEMAQAIEKANQTLENFKVALLSNNSNFKNFALKIRFEKDQGGGEHVWLDNVTFKNNNYFGVVGNVPASTTEVKLGDTIQIKTENISDWMYLDKNKLRGGYTIRALRKRMTDAERKQFDLECDMTIND